MKDKSFAHFTSLTFKVVALEALKKIVSEKLLASADDVGVTSKSEFICPTLCNTINDLGFSTSYSDAEEFMKLYKPCEGRFEKHTKHPSWYDGYSWWLLEAKHFNEIIELKYAYIADLVEVLEKEIKNEDQQRL